MSILLILKEWWCLFSHGYSVDIDGVVVYLFSQEYSVDIEGVVVSVFTWVFCGY